MSKYFMKKTHEELNFGDTIEVEMEKEGKHNTSYVHMEIPFVPELIDFLIEEDIIEKKEESFEKEVFSNDTIIDGLLEVNEEMEKRIDCLEQEVAKLKKLLSKKKVVPVQ